MGFATEAVLANWDVIGMANDNILVDKSGIAWRIDVGGSLDYRAKGKLKGSAFGNTVGEMETFRDKYKNPTAHKVFGGMSNDEIKQSAKLLDHHLQKMSDALPKKYWTQMTKRAIDALNYANQLPDGSLVVRKDAQGTLVIPPTQGASGEATTTLQPQSSKAPSLKFKVPKGQQHPVYDSGDKLVNFLHEILTRPKMLTPLMDQKIRYLNPNGIIGNMVIMPSYSFRQHTYAKLKEELPAHGLKMKRVYINKKHLLSGSIEISGPAAGSKNTPTTVGQHFELGLSPKKPGHDAEFEKFKQAMTKDEKSAVSSWKGNSSNIRKQIAKGVKPDTTAAHFLTAIEKAPRYSGILYRGVSGTYAQEQIKSIVESGVGSTWIDHAPMGMSRKAGVGHNFNSGQLMFKIHAKDARMIEDIGGYSSEGELVTVLGTKFKITGVHQKATHSEGSKYTKHKLELLVEMRQMEGDELVNNEIRFANNESICEGEEKLTGLPSIELEDFMEYVTLFNLNGELVWPPTIEVE